MPAAEVMGWNSTQKRWYKRYRGKLYFVSPRQLKCEATKEASRQAANEWWDAKQQKVDTELGEAKRHPANVIQHYQEALENHRLYAKWQRKYENSPTAAEKSETMMEWLQDSLASDDPPFPLSHWQYDPLHELRMQQKTDDVMGFNIFWRDRYLTLKKEERHEQATPLETTIRAHIQDFLALKKAQAQAKGKIGGFYSYKQWLMVFSNWVDPFAPIASIDEKLWERWYIFVSGKIADGSFAPSTAKDYVGAARSFIRNRWEKKYLELPRNLNSKQLAISIPDKTPLVFSVEEITDYIAAAKERVKLYIYLMLNCGMYPVDIAKLRQDEVDWEAGRINRKRTKTRDRSSNIPKVDYKLWGCTFDLLKRYRSTDATLVLLNRDGKPLWVESGSKNDKLNRNSNIHSAYFQLVKGMKLPPEQRKGLKAFRKTGATMLEQSAYGRFTEHYLGEAPQTITSKHYSHKNGPEFDAAITWLGEQLGISSPSLPVEQLQAASGSGS
jgi:integrase